MIRYASDIITVLEPDGTIRYESPSIERILGYLPEELIGRSAFDYIHPNDLDRVVEALAEALKIPGASLTPVEYRFRHADGSWRHLESVGNNLTDDPAVAGFVVNSRDVTGKVLAEEALQKSEARFRALFEQAAVGMTHVTLEGRLLKVNEKLCETAGYAREELLRLDFREIVHPDDLADDPAPAQRLLAGGIETHATEKRFFRKDGRLRWARVTVSLVRGAAGRPEHFVAVIEDISARKRDDERIRSLNETLERRVAGRTAELEVALAKVRESRRKLAESEQQFRASFQQAPVGMAHISILSRWVRVNGKLCEMLGYDEDEMLRMGFQEVTHPADLDADQALFVRTLRGEMDTYSVEKRYVRKDGRRIWVEQTLSVVRNTATGAGYFVCIVEDVTGRKLSELLAAPLTPTEETMLGLVARGETNREISAATNFSVGSVKLHVQRILVKLRVSTRRDASVRAMEIGLLPPPRKIR